MDNGTSKIGKYTLIKQLGCGGFGTVYLAEDPKLHQQVAIKVFQLKDTTVAQQATSSSTDAFGVLKQRFLEEARILRQLSLNPNIIDVYEFDELPDGTPYYVMPYLPNSFKDELGSDATDISVIADLPASEKPRALPLNKAIDYLQQILQAMSEVHSAGLVHRDIKPANILLTTQGKVQLCDFGIAKLPDAVHSETGVGMGSRNYMSPEQRQSAKHVDARSDVYSLGVLAYRMLTGTLPEGRFAEPVLYQPQLSSALNRWVLTALEQQKERRFTNAGEMLTQFKQALSIQGNYANQAVQPSQPPEDHTVAFIKPRNPELRADLKPLKAKIIEFLKQDGMLNDKSLQQLRVLADIVDVSENELKALIHQVELEITIEMVPFKKWKQAAEKQLEANNGKLSAELYATLLEAGRALGKTDAELLPFLGSQTVSERIEEKRTTNEQKKLPLKLITAAVMLTLIGFGGWQYQQYSSEQAAQVQQDERAWQQAKTRHTEQSYREYLTTQTTGRFRANAQQQLRKLQQDAEANAQLAAEQARQQLTNRSEQISSVQTWLIKHGYPLSVTGELDARTKIAIKAFEKAENLLVTGEVDTILLSKLEEVYWLKEQTALDSRKKTALENNSSQDVINRENEQMLTQRSETVGITEQQKIANTKTKIDDHDRAKQQAIINSHPDAEKHSSNKIVPAEELTGLNEPQSLPDTELKSSAEDAASKLSQPKNMEEKITKITAEQIGLLLGQFVSIPAGRFMMGCSQGEECTSSESPRHQVSINAFHLMETEITFAMWDACVESGGCSHVPLDGGWGRGSLPVINVSFLDISEQFIPWLNKTTGRVFRLPTEAEWEYAARGGRTTKYRVGDSIRCGQARYGRREKGECGDSQEGAVAVKSYTANGYGLYDMRGNVWELTQDCWNENYADAPEDGSSWMSGECEKRVVRGGSWYNSPLSMRLSYRSKRDVADRDNYVGFRLVQSLRE